MKLIELKAKGVRFTRRCFRFRLRTFVLLTLLIAGSVGAWRAYWDRQVIDSIRARDAALQNWRQVRLVSQLGGNAPADAEPEARALYFQRRSAVEEALNRAWWQSG